MFVTQYKAVFFDVGGTLLKVHPSVGDVYANHARNYGFTGEADDLNRTFRDAWKALGGMESLGQQRGIEVERAFWREIVHRAFAPSGGLHNFDAYFEHIYQVFNQAESWRVFPDVLDSNLLDELQNAGVKMGIISNWDSRLETILENMNLSRYFEFVLASTVVGSAKPDVKIFEEALSRSGVQPEEACHIGDEPDTDIKGAQSAGIDSILVDRTQRHPEQPVRVIQSFWELVES